MNTKDPQQGLWQLISVSLNRVFFSKCQFFFPIFICCTTLHIVHLPLLYEFQFYVFCLTIYFLIHRD